MWLTADNAERSNFEKFLCNLIFFPPLKTLQTKCSIDNIMGHKHLALVVVVFTKLLYLKTGELICHPWLPHSNHLWSIQWLTLGREHASKLAALQTPPESRQKLVWASWNAGGTSPGGCKQGRGCTHGHFGWVHQKCTWHPGVNWYKNLETQT